MMNTMLQVYRPLVCCASFHTGVVVEAARKGTRMKRDAKKKAAKQAALSAATKIPPAPKAYVLRMLKNRPLRLIEDKLPYPHDDVYSVFWHKRPYYTFEEAVEMHRQTLHPTMINAPNANLMAFVELNMSTVKKTQFVGAFSSIVLLPNLFSIYHERTILALANDDKMVEDAWKAGATMAYGPECVRMAQLGKIVFKDYEHIVANAQLLPHLINSRDQLKRKFPSPSNGTAGFDITALVTRFSRGLEYTVVKDPVEFDYATINAQIGTLNMPTAELEENINTLLVDIEKQKPRARPNDIIAKVWLKCPPSPESFKISHDIYFQKKIEAVEDNLEEATETLN